MLAYGMDELDPSSSLYPSSFPAEVISHAVWLYFRFPLSLWMVEGMLAARGIEISHETVRQWTMKFGQDYANQIRRRLPVPGDKWRLDEAVINIAGRKHWLWRAVDQHGTVLRPYSGPEPPQCESRQAPAAKAPQEVGHRPACDDHGQAGQLWCGQARDHAGCRALTASRLEQPCGEQSPAYPATRTHHEELQISRSGPTIPLCSRSGRKPLPPSCKNHHH
jgi:putative transposase